jgi:hypothetical protein
LYFVACAYGSFSAISLTNVISHFPFFSFFAIGL